jgi:hypothetical protein
VDPGELQRLRYLEDKIINKECRCLERTRSLLLTLITLNNALPSRNDEFEARSMAIEQELRMLDYRVECLSSAADTLGQRTQATLALV